MANRWAGQPTIVVLAKAFGAVPLPVSVRDLQIFGALRIRLFMKVRP